MSLLQFAFGNSQPPAKKQHGEKSKANPMYEKQREKMKKQHGKTPRSGQPVVKSTGGSLVMRHRTRCSTPHVATMPWDSSTVHHCMSICTTLKCHLFFFFLIILFLPIQVGNLQVELVFILAVK